MNNLLTLFWQIFFTFRIFLLWLKISIKRCLMSSIPILSSIPFFLFFIKILPIKFLILFLKLVNLFLKIMSSLLKLLFFMFKFIDNFLDDLLISFWWNKIRSIMFLITFLWTFIIIYWNSSKTKVGCHLYCLTHLKICVE